MAIDKSIGFLWKASSFSMKTCCNIVKKYPISSSVTTLFFLLYMFLPSLFIYLICSFIVYALVVVVYRVFFCKGIDNVRGYKKTDEKPSIVSDDDMGKNISVSGHSQATRRRNVIENDGENCTQSSIQDKSVVCPDKLNDDLVDKPPVVEETLKEIREVKVANEGSPSPKASQIVASPPFTSGSIDETKHPSVVKAETEGESSDDSEEEDAREERNKAVEWNVDDQINLSYVGNIEIERNDRLENLIARRRARKLLDIQVRNTLMRPATTDSGDHIPCIMTDRSNQFLASDSEMSPIPGSAPSVLLPMHQPFNLYEEKPILADQHKESTFCRHESFSLGAFSPPAGSFKDQNLHDFSFHHGISKKADTSGTGYQLDKNVVENTKSTQENEPPLSGDSSENHAIQEGQASERVFDLADSHHEEDGSEVETKEIVHENVNDRCGYTSSSEENMSLSDDNRAEFIRSLSYLAQKDMDTARDDNDQEHDIPYNSDRLLYEKTKGNSFFGEKRMCHAPSSSLASDMQVEISEVSSPQSTSSNKSYTFDDYINKEVTSGGEDTWAESSHLSGVDINEPNLREVNEVNEQDINHNLDPNTSNLQPEKIIQPDEISSHSQSSNLNESTEGQTTDINREHLSVPSASIDSPNDSEHSNKQVEAHKSNSENSEEASPQEVNVVNESVVSNNDETKSSESRKVAEPEVVAEVSIPHEETSRKSSEDTDGTLNRHSDFISSKTSNQNNNPSVPLSNEVDPSALQNKPSQEQSKPTQDHEEGNASNHNNKPVITENEPHEKSESVKDSASEPELLVKQVDLAEPSNSISSESIQDTKENDGKVVGEHNAVDTLKTEEQVKNIDSDMKSEKHQDEEPNLVLNQQPESVKDSESGVELLVEHVDSAQPSNSITSKSIENATANDRNVAGGNNAVDTSKATREIKDISSDVKTEEHQEAEPSMIIDQHPAPDGNDNSESIKVVESELRTSTSNEAEVIKQHPEPDSSDNSESIKVIQNESRTSTPNEAELNKDINQHSAPDGNDNSESIKVVESESRTSTPNEAVSAPKQLDQKEDFSRISSHMEIKEPLDSHEGKSTMERIVEPNHNETATSAAEEKEIKPTNEAT